MRSVLVTGANGFIGKHLISKLLERKIKVTAIIRNENALKNIRHKNFNVVYCAMEEIDKLSSVLKDNDYFDTIYHLAWTGASGIDRADYIQQSNNIKHTLDMVHVAAKIGVKRFIGAGSLSEYDNLYYLSKDDVIPCETALYGVAKISAHFMSKVECNRLNIEHVWGIFSNVYGIGNETDNFINYVLKCMISGKHLAVTTGEQNYDFVYISDFIDGLYLMGEYGKSGFEYFIGSGAPRKLKEYIYSIRDVVDNKIDICLGEVPFHGMNLELEKLSINKLQQCTGYRPIVSFESGIRKTLEWMRNSI